MKEIIVGSGIPPTPPPYNGNFRVPEDAPGVFDSLKEFFEYLRRVDSIIENYMRGYEALAAHRINDMPVLPLEPCVVTEGLLGHIRFHQTMLERLGEYPSNLDQGIPVIVRDEALLTATDGYTFHNDHVNHLYVQQSQCEELEVRRFNERIIRVAHLFRLNVDRLIEQRTLLSNMNNIMGGEKYLKKIIDRPTCDANLQAILFNINRQINDIYATKIDVEKKISNYHFAIENLRAQLLRMFDEMFARRMGWGYLNDNPGHHFMVFVRHTPFVQNYVLPPYPAENSDSDDSNNNSNNLERNKRGLDNKIKNCIVKVLSIDQLSNLVTKKSKSDFQIFHFVEEEEKLKLKIKNLEDVFYSWIKTSHGYFGSKFYTTLYAEVYQMFANFLQDSLKNPRFGSLQTKSEIIEDFKKVILKDLDYSLKWWYEPTESIKRMKEYINKIYGHKYPKKPIDHPQPFHSEL